MTREELYSNVLRAVTDAMERECSGRDAAADIIELFDRYVKEHEEGQWKPCSEPPVGGRDVIVWEMSPNYPRTMYYYNQEWHDTGMPTELGQSAVWRELPTPPRRGEG